MKFTIEVNVRLGTRHQNEVKDENGVRKFRIVQAVYEATNFRPLGYISKRGVRFSAWEAFNKDGHTIGLYTSRQSAIHYTIRAALDTL